MEAPERKRIEAQTVLFTRHHGSYEEMGQVYHRLYQWARAHDVKLTGKGLTVFLSPPAEFNPDAALFEVCLPVASAPKSDTKVGVKELPACTVASVTVKGPYRDIPAHYTEMLAWLSVQGWEIAGPPREVYVKRPGSAGGGDPKEFVTEIQFPIKE